MANVSKRELAARDAAARKVLGDVSVNHPNARPNQLAEQLKDAARAAFLWTDSVKVDAADAEIIDFKDFRYGGKYVILRAGGEVVAVYKRVARLGPDRAVRRNGGIAFEVDRVSFGLKRIKRAPKGLI
jgi:hypothetical protein